MDYVLVTGGAGFIGSHLVETLIFKKYKVRVLDSLVYGKLEWIHPEAEFIKGDISSLEECRKAMKGGIEGIFHMAAMSRAGPSIDAIDSCTTNNIIGTQNILIAGREAKVKKIIYSGSSTFYGNRPVPHNEFNTQSDFLNFYSLSKYVGEKYTLMFDRLFGLSAIVLRYFNVYGPRQPEVGAYALVLGIFLKRLVENKTLEIHGDGNQRRDFIHVRDVVAANIASYESDIHNEIFNVGSGKNISIKELADLISKNQTFLPRRPGDAEETLADITNITKKINWRPSISFEEGLQEMIKFNNS
jgi:UDP-glucose 4-epimerase